MFPEIMGGERSKVMSQAIQGHCLCGAVQVRVEDFNGDVEACHCGMCRRWNGGPAFAIAAGTDLHVTGDEHVRRYRSSDRAERAFCVRCGTNLYFRLRVSDEHYVWAGLFDSLPDARLTHQIYIDHKPGWYALANETEVLTEAEIIERFQ